MCQKSKLSLSEKCEIYRKARWLSKSSHEELKEKGIFDQDCEIYTYEARWQETLPYNKIYFWAAPAVIQSGDTFKHVELPVEEINTNGCQEDDRCFLHYGKKDGKNHYYLEKIDQKLFEEYVAKHIPEGQYYL